MATVDVVKLLQRLVAIDSTSSRPNSPVLDLVEEELRKLQFVTRRQCWQDAAGVEKANLIARRGPDVPGGLALVGHSDCVPFDPAWSGALTGELRDGCLFGRGSADTKAFLAAVVSACAQTGPLQKPLHVIATADEEVGCLGAKHLVEEGTVRPAHAIIGEPTRLIPVRAHKGYCLAEVEIAGVEAHSAFPELGTSAIFAAGRLLREIEQIQGSLSAETDAQFSPPNTTVNVGVIQGGRAKNVIPGRCTFLLEWRPIPGQDVRRVLGLVESAAESIVSASRQLRIEIRPSRLDAGISVSRDAGVVRFLEAESGRPSGTIPFGTELPQLTALGAEACVFGPGDIRDAHRTGEFVPLADLQAAERILKDAISQFCGGAA